MESLTSLSAASGPTISDLDRIATLLKPGLGADSGPNQHCGNRVQERRSGWSSVRSQALLYRAQIGNWDSLAKKTEHGTLVPCSVDSFFDQFPSRSLSLLKRRASCRGASTRRAVTDHTRLVREKHALTGGANRDRRTGDGIADGRRIAVGRPVEHVAALRARCQNRSSKQAFVEVAVQGTAPPKDARVAGKPSFG